MESQEERADAEEKARIAKQLLAEALEKEGLDEEYWLPKLSEILGVKSINALKHLQYEDCLKLECEVRYPWETKALQRLLGITDNKRAVDEVQKQWLEMMKQRQEEAKSILRELEEMQKSRSHNKEMMRQKEEALQESHVHPMDLQMAIFHCADDFMRQQLSSKLAFCQFALPLLVPNPGTSQIEFPLWSLSQIKKSWKGTVRSGEQTRISSHNNKLIYQAEMPIVSFLRIGSSPSSSKSQLLNALLSTKKHDTFFHRHCKGSTKDCFLMKGVVEISWYLPRGSDDDSFNGPVAFCNLHGDARDHEPQLQFLQEISAVNVVLVSESDQSNEKGRKILHDLWQSQRPLVCLFTEKESIAAGRSSQNIRIGIKNRNEAELVGELTKTIRDLVEGSSTLVSLNACLSTARQRGFLVDEDAKACVTAKETAIKLVNLLKKEKLSEIKSQLLPLQGKLWYKWCEKDKELTRLQEKRNKSIEHHRSQIELEKSAIRREQLGKAFPLNHLLCRSPSGKCGHRFGHRNCPSRAL
uniref:Up-regulator of cell proliferation-like domain-containing protein n=1 Tax=Cairina moschata TaxID=8855 RepID=A0A8C3CKE8_CAIMO